MPDLTISRSIRRFIAIAVSAGLESRRNFGHGGDLSPLSPNRPPARASSAFFCQDWGPTDRPLGADIDALARGNYGRRTSGGLPRGVTGTEQ